MKSYSTIFTFERPEAIKISMPVIRKALAQVRDELLAHEINGGDKKLDMNAICIQNACGMAACIGGWTSIFLLGFEGKINDKQDGQVDDLFETLIKVERETYPDRSSRRNLSALFYDYADTVGFNRPNVAATAINRYLNGQSPWPEGEMPKVLPYTKPAKPKSKR